MHVALHWFFPLILSLLVTPVHAQLTNEYDEDAINIDCTDLFPADEMRIDEPGFFTFLDTPHETVSSGLETMARSIDEFFANEKVFYETSGSYLRYSINNLWEEAGQHSTTGELDISLHLRRTEEKLKLVIESDPIEKQDNLKRVTDTPTPAEDKERNVYAGVQREYGDQTRWRVKPSIGLKVRFPVEYYARVRAYRDFYFDKWKLHLLESLYWFDVTGTGVDSSMEWDRLLGEKLLFRSGSLLRYTDEYDYFDMSQTFSVTQTFSKRSAITYSFSAFGISEPSIHATDYILQARYRQIIHSDYLFLEIVPQMRFQIANQFTEEDSLLFRIEWLFTR